MFVVTIIFCRMSEMKTMRSLTSCNELSQTSGLLIRSIFVYISVKICTSIRSEITAVLLHEFKKLKILVFRSKSPHSESIPNQKVLK